MATQAYLSLDKYLREPLRQFTVDMENTLRDNDHKSGWTGCDHFILFERLLQEVGELAPVLHLFMNSTDEKQKARLLEQVIKETADVANFCMMISDNAKLEVKAPQPEQPAQP